MLSEYGRALVERTQLGTTILATLGTRGPRQRLRDGAPLRLVHHLHQLLVLPRCPLPNYFLPGENVDLTPALPSGFQVHLLSPLATLPVRGSPDSVGLDITTIESTTIQPGSRSLLATGLQFSIPLGVYGRIAPRSGLALQHHLDVAAGVIDPDYRGEVKVLLVNNGSKAYTVSVGDRVAQLILEQALFLSPRLSKQPISTTARGEGGFGSTGKRGASSSSRKRMAPATPVLLKGIGAAVAAAEHVLEHLASRFDAVSIQGAIQQTTLDLQSIQALPGTARSTRPSSRLKGFDTVYSLGDADLLSSTSGDYDAIKHHIHISFHSVANMFTELLENLNRTPGCLVVVSLPSKGCPGTHIDPQTLLGFIVNIVDLVLDQGGDVVIKVSSNDIALLRREVLALQHLHSLHSAFVYVPGGTLRVLCSREESALQLQALSDEINRDEESASFGKPLQQSPIKLMRNILAARYGHYTYAPAMSCTPSTNLQGHRERDQAPRVFTPIETLEPVGSSLQAVQEHLGVLVPSCVTKLLDRREALRDPKAVAAVRAEADALVAAGTCLEASVVEQDVLRTSARASKKTVHFGQLMTICSVKYWEKPETFHKYKGRVCFRGDCVKDEHGHAAVFNELSSSPTNVPDTNSTIAYGLCPGHKVSCADAVRAYIQSELGTKTETWVLVPRELWPTKWGDRFTRPMCRLIKSLYGHPESGGWWERHLTRAIVTLKGVPVSGHPSVFFFKEQRLLLNVYVDDLMIAGDDSKHESFWKALRAIPIELEDPEPLGRFLGREHPVSVSGALVSNQAASTVRLHTVAFEMSDYARSAVELYAQHTGIVKFKHATTPFVPDGSLVYADDDVVGDLAPHACSMLMKLLWLGRLSRPDLLKPVSDLATRITKWSKNNDRELFRLVCYVNATVYYRLVGTIGDDISELSLKLFVDADFAGDRLDAKSTSGGYLVLVGPQSFFPLMWISKRQTSVSRSTTESEVVSLAGALFSEAIPAMILWECLLDRPVRLSIQEDNQATIRVVLKGFSPKLRHISRTHKVNISSVHEIVQDDNISVDYCETDKQAADIFTKALAPMKWGNALALLGMECLESPTSVVRPSSSISSTSK